MDDKGLLVQPLCSSALGSGSVGTHCTVRFMLQCYCFQANPAGNHVLLLDTRYCKWILYAYKINDIIYILYMYASTNTEADCLHVCMYGCIHVLYRSVLHFIVVNIIYNRSLVNIAHISSSVQHFTIVFLWSGSDLLGWV